MRLIDLPRKKSVRIVSGTFLAIYYCVSLAALPSFGASLDRDGDHMPNRWEVNQGLNPDRANGHKDADHDGLVNVAEYRHSTDATDEDADNDGMDDGDEVNDGRVSTDVDDADTNNDGTFDGDEDANHNGIDNEDGDDANESCIADDNDSDGDHVANEDENDFGTSPHDADSDNDGTTDGNELSGSSQFQNEDADDQGDDLCDDDQGEDGDDQGEDGDDQGEDDQGDDSLIAAQR